MSWNCSCKFLFSNIITIIINFWQWSFYLILNHWSSTGSPQRCISFWIKWWWEFIHILVIDIKLWKCLIDRALFKFWPDFPPWLWRPTHLASKWQLLRFKIWSMGIFTPNFSLLYLRLLLSICKVHTGLNKGNLFIYIIFGEPIFILEWLLFYDFNILYFLLNHKFLWCVNF